MDPIVCDRCGARTAVDQRNVAECEALIGLHYYEEFVEERRILERVLEFHRRFPEAVGAFTPHPIRVLESDDPAVQEQFFGGVPFDQIKLEPKTVKLDESVLAEFADVVEYLSHTSVDPEKRLEHLEESIAEFRESAKPVPCTRCKTGRLRVDREQWDNFAEQYYPSITWLWPEWHSLDDDGTLHVKASGYRCGYHWNGEQPISPDAADYAFWRWFVEQPKFHRLVDETELPAIREEWSIAVSHEHSGPQSACKANFGVEPMRNLQLKALTTPIPICPHCKAELDPPDAMICIHCGFYLLAGAEPPKENRNADGTIASDGPNATDRHAQ